MVDLFGFPCDRDRVRHRFKDHLAACGPAGPGPCVRLLCLHQAVEGATVGPVDFTFRARDDVIRGRDIPARVARASMFDVSIDADVPAEQDMIVRLTDLFATLDPDGIVRLRPIGEISKAAGGILSARRLRALAPKTMNVSVVWKTT